MDPWWLGFWSRRWVSDCRYPAKRSHSVSAAVQSVQYPTPAYLQSISNWNESANPATTTNLASMTDYYLWLTSETFLQTYSGSIRFHLVCLDCRSAANQLESKENNISYLENCNRKHSGGEKPVVWPYIFPANFHILSSSESIKSIAKLDWEFLNSTCFKSFLKSSSCGKSHIYICLSNPMRIKRIVSFWHVWQLERNIRR